MTILQQYITLNKIYKFQAKNNFTLIIKRTMMSSRCLHAARAAYHVALNISNYQPMENSTDNNKNFIKKVVDNALDLNQGIDQHKAALWKHMSSTQVPSAYYFDPFKSQISTATDITYNSEAVVDFRTVNELPVLRKYVENFQPDLAKIHISCDTHITKFFKAKQDNPDYSVTIKTKTPKVFKNTYQDQKAGKGMFEHNTRGSIGTMFYDVDGNNIQVTRKPFNTQELITYNFERLEDIKNGLLHDNVVTNKHDFNDPFIKILSKGKEIVFQMIDKNFQEVENLHNKLQNHLWEELQRCPNYNRSISFVFLKQIITSPMTEKETTFSTAFHAKLKDNYVYNLDKAGDVNDLYKAFIYAGKKVDPLFIDKLRHLNDNGIILTDNVLKIMKELSKNAVY